MGEGVFTHESGIHVHGLLRDRQNYQSLDPRDLGREHRLVLGKHSGVAGVFHAFERLGLSLDETQARKILSRVRAFANEAKDSPGEEDLKRFYRETRCGTVAS